MLLTMGVLALSCALIPSADEATLYMACRGAGEACSDGTECLTLVCCLGLAMRRGVRGGQRLPRPRGL